MVETAFIYTLNDPETGEVRYLGKLDNNPRKRLRQHITESRTKNHHRANWIRSLTARGLKPTLELLDEVPFGEWEFWEREYIRVFRAIGIRLVNSTDGGDGGATMLGKKFTSEHCAAISEGNLGKKFTPEHCAAISAAKSGAKQSEEVRRRRIGSQAGEKHPLFGKTHSPAALVKMRNKREGASSGFHGVYWRKDYSLWGARINFARKRTHIGFFKNEIDAARAYDGAARNLCGSLAVLNFP